jgi:hypothetical protein
LKGKGLTKKIWKFCQQIKSFCHKVKVLPRNKGFSNKGLTKKQRVFVEKQRFNYEKV